MVRTCGNESKDCTSSKDSTFPRASGLQQMQFMHDLLTSRTFQPCITQHNLHDLYTVKKEKEITGPAHSIYLLDPYIYGKSDPVYRW